MNNFFETYLDWVIEQYNNGEDIVDILSSGYTASTETYYCPECAYTLANVETYLIYAVTLGSDEPTKVCCTPNKFCSETNFSPQYMYGLLDVGVIEQSSTSEIYNTNLCYLYDRLFSEDYPELEIFDIVIEILNNGIIIWCYENTIYVNTIKEYLTCTELGLDYCISELTPNCCVNINSSVEAYLKYAEAVGDGGGVEPPIL